MSTAAVIAIVIGVVVVLAAVSFFTLARRSDVRGAGALSGETVQRDKSARRATTASVESAATTAADVEAAGSANRTTSTALATLADREMELVPWTPPDPEAIGESRRQFFNRATVALMSVGLVTFAASAFVAFLWPTGTGGFGGQVNVGKLGAIKDGIKQGNGFFYAPEARSWITEYPAEAVPAAELIYPETLLVTMRQGIVILSQKCPHLGCRVPECKTSQWFECQCHGSQYNRAGEKKAGPAPRGMDRFPATIAANGDVVIDTGKAVTGPAIGVNTTGQEAEGPHCTGGGH
jgi:cytochrome b6-f complex iron-sulfur subunit